MTTQHTPGRKKIYESAPSKIWLGIFTIEDDQFFPADHEGICWADNQFADLNVGYVRGDIHKQIEAQRDELLAALKSAWLWMENQADAQSKGGHATFDLMMLRYERDMARAAIAKAEGKA